MDKRSNLQKNLIPRNHYGQKPDKQEIEGNIFWKNKKNSRFDKNFHRLHMYSKLNGINRRLEADVHHVVYSYI